MGKNPNYLGAWDLDDCPNREIVLTIAKIVDELVTGAEGRSENNTVCYWKEDSYKPMILNVTNKKTICNIFLNSIYSESWCWWWKDHARIISISEFAIVV